MIVEYKAGQAVSSFEFSAHKQHSHSLHQFQYKHKSIFIYSYQIIRYI